MFGPFLVHGPLVAWERCACKECQLHRQLTRLLVKSLTRQWYDRRVLFKPQAKLKRVSTIPMVRVTDQERAVAEFLAARLSETEQAQYGLADVLRAGLGVLYAREWSKMSETERSKAPLALTPDEV